MSNEVTIIAVDEELSNSCNGCVFGDDDSTRVYGCDMSEIMSVLGLEFCGDGFVYKAKQ